MIGQNQTETTLLDYKQGVGAFTQKAPTIGSAYNEFTETCFQEGALNKKQKHLIALGISLQSLDKYCITYHLKGCLDSGCTEKEIVEVVGVAAAIGSGAIMGHAASVIQQGIHDFNQLK